MKKYFILSIIINIILSVISFYGLINYLAFSSINSLSTIIDTLFLLLIVILDVLINYFIFKILKIDNKKQHNILIPSSVFMFIQAILFLLIK